MRLCELKGIKTVREKLFNSLGIFTAKDLLNYFPSKYFDVSCESDFDSNESPKLLYAEVVSVNIRKRAVKAVCKCGGRNMEVIWFNQPYIYSKLEKDKKYVFFGKCAFNGMLTLINPVYEAADSVKKLKGVMPVYPLCKGLNQSVVSAAIKDLLGKTEIKSLIPDILIKKYSLGGLNAAYRNIHMPSNLNLIASAADRTALELMFCRFSNYYIQGKNTSKKRLRFYGADKDIIKPFIQSLGFKLTKGQLDSVNDILNDLNSAKIMNRMLQGDVGSGKTAAALTAAFYVAKCGGQCAFMAPTELLARQHYAKALKYFEVFGIKVEFLSGSLNAAQRDTVLFNIKNHVCDVVIGTHSIFSDDVEFADLRLVICDEQHRFGVKQRNSIKNKGSETDMLVMSATPLPRTLNLAFFGELSVSVIKEKPAGRAPVQTCIVPENKTDDMYKFILNLIAEGRQAYIVSKSIEADGTDNDSAKELYKKLSVGALKSCKTGLLHGNMAQNEKDDAMRGFINGDTDALIATSIIEVGIDVPNAAVIVIYEADKFGLAQLHQLRGRVGRGSHKSYCFLLCKNAGGSAAERLGILKNTDDGFELAEKDMELRGAGDFLGLKQHGFQSGIKNLNIRGEIIKQALELFKEALICSGFTNSLDFNTEENELKDVILN